MKTRAQPRLERAPAGVLTNKPIGLRLKPDELQKVQTYAAHEHHTLAAFARLAMLRGLAEYERDRSSLST
jgi:hypothetical protein